MRNINMVEQTKQPLVKPEPLATKLNKRARFSNKLAIAGTTFLLLGAIILVIVSFIEKKLSIILPLYLFLFLVNGSSTFYSNFVMGKIRRYWGQIEQRRQEAAAGNQALLANEQPVPDAQALTLPITIEQRPRISSFVLFVAYLAFSCLIGVVISLLVITHILPLPIKGISLIVYLAVGTFILLTLAIGGWFTFVMYSRVRQQITLTESGLIQAGISSKVRSIPWSEARLFALLGIYGAKKYPHPVVLELASEHEIIRWNWLHQNSLKVFYFANSRLSPEDYERQMHGVLSVIAAKTGLALYDLRKTVPVPSED